ncbi:hypothetical protein Pla108_09430 [Botrimarina colliarenosi]|uniref:Uncharacterized protein n=1 Tax=Botrimarina colliarenosi TaxID=2528001 RepID=A0A5C6AK27_9BACT|nr:hypothetical protein Pla108_09430 [Botrimarina colliarenosi]
MGSALAWTSLSAVAWLKTSGVVRPDGLGREGPGGLLTPRGGHRPSTTFEDAYLSEIKWRAIEGEERLLLRHAGAIPVLEPGRSTPRRGAVTFVGEFSWRVYYFVGATAAHGVASACRSYSSRPNASGSDLPSKAWSAKSRRSSTLGTWPTGRKRIESRSPAPNNS